MGGRTDFRYVTQQIVIRLSYCITNPRLCVLHLKVRYTNIAFVPGVIGGK